MKNPVSGTSQYMKSNRGNFCHLPAYLHISSSHLSECHRSKSSGYGQDGRGSDPIELLGEVLRLFRLVQDLLVPLESTFPDIDTSDRIMLIFLRSDLSQYRCNWGIRTLTQTSHSPMPISSGAFLVPLPPPPTIRFPGRY